MSEEPIFSESEQVALAITPIISASLSATGSFSIIYIILSDRKRKLSKMYHRIMLGVSLGDFITSLGFCSSTFLMPAGTPGVWHPSGNQATCSLQGLLSNFTYISLFYSGFLALHFLVCTVSRHRISRFSRRRNIERFEPIVHLLPWLYVFTTTFAALFMGLYNPSPLSIGCWIAPYPFDCLEDPDVDCTRGENAEIYRWLFGGMFIIPVIVTVSISMMAIYFSVRKQLMRMERLYSFEFSARSSTLGGPQQSDHSRPNTNTAHENLQEIRTQGILYCSSVLMVYLWTGTGKILENAGKDDGRYFPISFLAQVFLPLQGLFNYVIYVRPLYRGLRREHPEESRLRTWGRVYRITWLSAMSSSAGSNVNSAENSKNPDLFDHPYIDDSSESSDHVMDDEKEGSYRAEKDETHEDASDSCEPE